MTTSSPNAWIDALEAPKKVTRNDVKGVPETLEALEPYLRFLKQPEGDFKARRLPQPPHALFYGGSGTGKTFLSLYLAGESGAKYVHSAMTPHGEWTAKAIHQFFEDSRAWVRNSNRPMLLFFDEVDTIAKRKDKGGIADASIVGQFLSELDGPTENPYGLVILGATNTLTDVEPTAIRARRLGVTIPFHPPDAAGYLELLTGLAKDAGLPPDLDYAAVAGIMQGRPASTAQQIIQRVKGLEALRGRPASDDDLVQVVVEETVGFKLPLAVSREEKIATAVHELGHALTARILGEAPAFLTLSPRGNAAQSSAGCTWAAPQKPKASSGEMRARLTALYGGAAAEKLCGIVAEQGCSRDFLTASSLAAQWVNTLLPKTLTGPCNLDGLTTANYSGWGTDPIPPEAVRMECVAMVKDLLVAAERAADEGLRKIGQKKIRRFAERLVQEKRDIVSRRTFLRYCQTLKI